MPLDIHRVKRICLWTIYACAFVAVAAPIFLHPGLFYNGIFVKALVFQTAVEIMAAAWIVLAWIDPSYRPSWRHPMVFTALLFSLALLITLPFSIDPSRSFWSDQGRMMGVLNLWHLVVFLLTVGTVWRTPREWMALLVSSNAVAAVIAVVGIWQWLTNHSLNFRPPSWLGNTDFFAAYALLQIFVAIALWRISHGAWRKVAVASVCLNLAAVFVAASRGAWVALFVSAAIGLVFYLRRFATKRRVAIASFLVVILLSAAAAGVLWIRSPSGDAWVRAHIPYTLSRLFTESFGDRTALWRIALQGFAQRPWVGWGLEQFPVVYNTFVEPNGRDRALQEMWYDRAHNQYLDLLVAIGLVGCLPYLLFWFATGWCVWQSARDLHVLHEVREARAALGVGLLAYLIFNLFLFDTPAAAALAFLLLSFFLDATRDVTLPFPVSIRAGQPHAPRLFLIVPLAVLTIAMEIYVNVLPYRSAVINKEAMNILGPDNALPLFQKAFAIPTMVDYTNRYLLIDVVGKLVDYGAWRSPSVRRVTALTAEQLAVNARESPGDFKAVVASANAERLNSAFEPSALERERVLGEQAQKLSPWRPESYLILADVAMQSGKNDEALELIAKARGFANNPGVLGRADFQQALVQARAGAWDRAMDALVLAEKEGYAASLDIRLALLMDHFSFRDKDVIAKAAAHAEEVGKVYPTRLDLIAVRAKMQNLNGNSFGAHALFDLFKTHAPSQTDQLRKELGWKE